MIAIRIYKQGAKTIKFLFYKNFQTCNIEDQKGAILKMRNEHTEDKCE